MLDYPQINRDLQPALGGSLDDHWQAMVEKRFARFYHGFLNEWQALVENLPELSTELQSLGDTVTIGSAEELAEQAGPEARDNLITQLKTLLPWRKGPFNLYGVEIDTEWRSDWKWQRLAPHISDLNGRTVLDVGCGNGYHLWRMREAGARAVLGVDPTQKFLAQFSVVKRFLGPEPVHLLPIGVEELPQMARGRGFDTVFSMGVLYHRRSPLDFLITLKEQLREGGELVLETLVVDGDEQQVLVPGDRYAQMRNVWFIPSAKALEHWLVKCGFKSVRTVDISTTSLEEQRSTEWMSFHSLVDFLDPKDISRTIEGYPAPKRAILIAER